MMDLKILATLTSTSAEADRTDVAAALAAAGYGETLREVEDACRRTGESDPLAALDSLRDRDAHRREVASALTDTLDDYREVITRIWSPRVARLRQLGKVARCVDPLETARRWDRAGQLLDELLELPEDKRVAAVRADARLRRPLFVWRLLDLEEQRRFESAEEALSLAQLACEAIGAERIPFRREASLESDTAALCKAVEANALRMLGDLPSASQLSFVAVSWLRRGSDPFVVGEVHSYRGAVELDLGQNNEADQSFCVSLAAYGDGNPRERQMILMQVANTKVLRDESGYVEFSSVYGEVFDQPGYGRSLREKAALSLSLSEIYYHDASIAERRLRKLPELLPENECWRSFGLGLIEERLANLDAAELLFRQAASGFLERGAAVQWAYVLLHTCQLLCQRGQWPVTEILAAAESLSASNYMNGAAAQAAQQLYAAGADRARAACLIKRALFSLRCPHAVNREGQ